VALLLAEAVELGSVRRPSRNARAYMPGLAWPWKKTWSPPPGWSLPRKKWLKPTSYSVADEAKVEMWPPTPTPGRCARCTMTAAFQRIRRRNLPLQILVAGVPRLGLAGIVLT
jgi:hypothetical protein